MHRPAQRASAKSWPVGAQGAESLLKLLQEVGQPGVRPLDLGNFHHRQRAAGDDGAQHVGQQDDGHGTGRVQRGPQHGSQHKSARLQKLAPAIGPDEVIGGNQLGDDCLDGRGVEHAARPPDAQHQAYRPIGRAAQGEYPRKGQGDNAQKKVGADSDGLALPTVHPHARKGPQDNLGNEGHQAGHRHHHGGVRLAGQPPDESELYRRAADQRDGLARGDEKEFLFPVIHNTSANV